MFNLQCRNYLSIRVVYVIFIQIINLSNAASIPTVIPTPVKNVCNVQIKDENLNLECASLQNNFELNEVFASLKLRQDNFITHSYQNATFHSLVVANSTFNSFQTAFDLPPVRTLHRLTLENVSFNHRPRWEDLGFLEQIRVFSVYNTTLPNSIDNEFGRSLGPALQSLTITESNITDIKANSFRELKILKHIRISHNKLQSFPKLISPEELEELRLDYNFINSLDVGAFTNFPKLRVLSLSSNSISSLPENVFSSVWNSTVHLELRDNPIKCDCRLLWIVTSPTKPGNIIGQCASPKRLFGKNLEDLTVEDLNC